jgi:hypothetical protein
MNKVTMCEIKSKEKITKNKPKKKYSGWSVVKRYGLWWTSFDAEWKNIAHPMDKTANWCNGGYSFILAHQNERRTKRKDKWRNPSNVLTNVGRLLKNNPGISQGVGLGII